MVDTQTATIKNIGSQDLYYQIIPSEVLPLIEWAPCDAPAACDNLLESGEEIQFALNDLRDKDTVELSFFWWHLLEQQDSGAYYVVDMGGWMVKLP